MPEPLLPSGAGPTIEAIGALDGAIAAAMPIFGPLVKDAENSYLKTSYMPLDTLLKAILPALLAQGVLITSCFQLVPGGFVVITSLSHAGGGWRSSLFPVGDPGNPQKVAAAATYGLRVNLQQLLALVATDDDGQHAAPAAPPQQWAPQQGGPVLPGEPVPPQQPLQPMPTANPYAQQPAPQGPAPQGPPATWQPPAAPQPAPTPYV